MNKFVCLTAVTGLLAAAVSCTGTFTTKELVKSESFCLSEGDTDSIKVDINVAYPESGLSSPAAANMSKALTSRLFGEQYAALAPEDAMERYTSDAVTEYREANLPLLQSALEQNLPHAVLSWEDYTYGEVAGGHKDVISYLVTKYAYTGGAHGMTALTSLNFDRKTGTLLTEGDFFTDGYEEKLSGLLTSHLEESLGENVDTSMLFVKEISPNGNFKVSADGVTYIYNQYEIGPYALGAIKVTVPWNELEGLIRK